MKKTIAILLAALLLVALFSACASSTTPAASSNSAPPAQTSEAQSAGQEPAAEALAPYTIQALFPGDTPIDFDLVLNEAENRMRDTVNVELDFLFVPWSDYGDKVQVKLMAGDAFDIHLNAPWLHMNQLISDGVIRQWDDLIDQYGPNLKKGIDQLVWDSNKFNDKIMGIPLGNQLNNIPQITVRGDLLRKYGLGTIRTMEDMEVYLRKVKENEPGMQGLVWMASDWMIWEVFNFDRFGVGSGQVLWETYDENGNLEPLVPLYENEFFLEGCRTVRRWYLDGLIPQDIMMVKDPKGAFLSGKSAASNCDGFDQATLAKNVPGGEISLAFAESNGKKLHGTFQVWNFLCLNSKSANPERVTMFMDWIFADQANFNLLSYGIEGKHWIDTGNGTFDLPPEGQTYAFPNYVLCQNKNFELDSAQWTAAYREYLDIANNPDTYTPSPLIGFSFDPEPVKNEIAKLNAIFPETILSVGCGIMDIDEHLPAIKKQLEDAGYLRFVEEVNRQVDAYLGR